MSNPVEKYVGIYIFGSYDGIKWAYLGGTEKTGTIVDIGAATERIDVKYYRIGFVGCISSDSDLEHIEMAVEGRLEQKIR